MTIRKSRADEVVRLAIARAEALKIRISVAVCEAGGRLVAFSRMDDSLPVSTTAAVAKARAAAIFGYPTAALVPIRQDPTVSLLAELEGNVALSLGGMPINIDGVLIGSVGVSGGTEEQDDDCARFSAEGGMR